MKKNLFLILTLASFSVFADPKVDKNKEEKIEEVRSKIVENLDKRIKQLQETKTCISSAKNRDDIRKCREKNREERKAMKAMLQDKRNRKNSQKD